MRNAAAWKDEMRKRRIRDGDEVPIDFGLVLALAGAQLDMEGAEHVFECGAVCTKEGLGLACGEGLECSTPLPDTGDRPMPPVYV